MWYKIALFSILISILELFVTMSVYQNFGLSVTVILYIILLIIGSVMMLILLMVFLLSDKVSNFMDEDNDDLIDEIDQINSIEEGFDEEGFDEEVKPWLKLVERLSGGNISKCVKFVKFVKIYVISIIFTLIPGILTSFLGVLLLVYLSVIRNQKINVVDDQDFYKVYDLMKKYKVFYSMKKNKE